MAYENAKQLLLIAVIHVGLCLTKHSNLNTEIKEKRMEMINTNATNNSQFNKEKIFNSIGNNTTVNQDGECSNGKAKCHFYIQRMINFYRKVKTWNCY